MTLEDARKRYPPIWVIYAHPRDFPRHFVVRTWYGETAGTGIYLRNTLHQARQAVWISGGEVRLPRMSQDDSVIVESWI